MIRESDEALYGMYNAGFFWTNQPHFSSSWKLACKTSRFFEQAALETMSDFTPEEECHTFGEEVNYGWWRMTQSPKGLQAQQAAWSASDTGLCVNDIPLVCIHTHWKTSDTVTNQFNRWILEQLEKLKHQPTIRTLLAIIQE